jgi:hypothetical protein
MMTNILTVSLLFDGFVLDFDVDINASKEFTNHFNSHGPGFVFAVAEVWLNIKGKRHLIIPSIRPANLIEMLKLDLQAFSEPACVPNLERIIPWGGWCTWMDEYWERFNEDSSTPNDEEIYDELIQLELMSSKNGRAAIYKYNGIPTIEIATIATSETGSIHVCGKFSPSEKAREITGIIKLITDAILINIRKPN